MNIKRTLKRSVTGIGRAIVPVLAGLWLVGCTGNVEERSSTVNGPVGSTDPNAPSGGGPSGTNPPTEGTPVSSCSTPPAVFTAAVGPSMGSVCKACHIAGGLAAGSRLVFSPGAGTSQQTYDELRAYAATSAALLLSKTVGQPAHAGGSPYGDTSSQAYKDLAELVQYFSTCGTASTPSPVPTLPPVAAQFWEGVRFSSDAATLARAAMVLVGRQPTAAETAAAAGGTAALRATLRGLMTGPAFNRFLDEVGDTHFLSPGAIATGTGGYSATDFPSAAAVINNNGAPAGVRTRFQAAVRREPVELMKFIVNNERPYTDMVSGAYTVANGVLAQYLGATVEGSFANPDDDTEWRMATVPNARLGGTREHAGVLSTQAWLSRFPTTATNRNRHRAAVLFRQFLATDVSAIAARPLNPDNTAFLVPTIENPACAACHDTIDPVAGGFQNWNEANRYLPFRTGSGKDHALPQSYRSNAYPRDAAGARYYQDGDNWFRDDRAPGYGTLAAPGGFTGNATALQWLGRQVAADPRFALGAVHFWYEGVFGRKPLAAPLDATSATYPYQLAAYEAQKAEFDQIAARFAAGQGQGAYNVKDLLVDLVLSRWFRAEAATGQNDGRALELGDVGTANLLGPAALNQKLVALVGQGYADFNNPYTGWALNYGDFDGRSRIVRAKETTMMQTVSIDRLVANRSCTFTRSDFDKAQGSRLLFPSVTLADTPGTAAGLAAITANVQHLHRWLLKEDLPATDAEIQRTVKLFTDVWNDRATAPSQQVTCTYNNNNDPNYTGRAWATVIAYLVGDPRFLYE